MKRVLRAEKALAVVLISGAFGASHGGDYGLDVLVELGAPGCQVDDGGQLTVTNTNPGASLDVSWHGYTTDPSAAPNLRFDSQSGNTCGTGQCAQTCPSDPGGCDDPDLNPSLNQCTTCFCEIGDERMVLQPLAFSRQTCNYALGCNEFCDNPNCPTVDFCSLLVGGPSGELGVIVEIHRVSYDDPSTPGGQCWLDLANVVLNDNNVIDVQEDPTCP